MPCTRGDVWGGVGCGRGGGGRTPSRALNVSGRRSLWLCLWRQGNGNESLSAGMLLLSLVGKWSISFKRHVAV
jgi:hypothetical protein